MESFESFNQLVNAASAVKKNDSSKKVARGVWKRVAKNTDLEKMSHYYTNGQEAACQNCANVFGSLGAYVAHPCNVTLEVCAVCGTGSTAEHYNSLSCFRTKPKTMCLLNKPPTYGYKLKEQCVEGDPVAFELTTDDSERNRKREAYGYTTTTMGKMLCEALAEDRPKSAAIYDSALNYARHVYEMMSYFTTPVIPCAKHFLDMQDRFLFKPAVFFAFLAVGNETIGKAPAPDTEINCECGQRSYGFLNVLDYGNALLNLKRFAYMPEPYTALSSASIAMDEKSQALARSTTNYTMVQNIYQLMTQKLVALGIQYSEDLVLKNLAVKVRAAVLWTTLYNKNMTKTQFEELKPEFVVVVMDNACRIKSLYLDFEKAASVGNVPVSRKHIIVRRTTINKKTAFYVDSDNGKVVFRYVMSSGFRVLKAEDCLANISLPFDCSATDMMLIDE